MQEYTPPANGFRTFLIVWATQSVSVFGSALTGFAINIWMLTSLYPLPEQKPQLAGALALVNLAFAIPAIFAAPIAGAWADRHDRKRIMMATDFFSGLISVLLMILVASNQLNLVLLIILIVIFAAANAFHTAAFDTSYVMLVTKEQLPRANGMMQTIFALSGILSPAFAAFLLAIPALARQNGMGLFTTGALAGLKDGAPLAMGIDALTFFLASGTLVFLFIPSPKRDDLQADGAPKKSIWMDVRFGITYIWQRRPLLWLLITFAFANFFLSPIGVMMPLLLKFNLSADWQARGFTLESAMAMLSSVMAVGGIIGGVAVSMWGGLKKRRVYGVLIPIILVGITLIFIGCTPWIYATAAGFFLMQAVVPAANIHSQSIWQGQVSPDMQGRVFAVRRVIAQFAAPVSTALAGLIGGLFDPGLVIAILGALNVIICGAQLFNPQVLRVDDKEYLDQLALAGS